MPTVTVLLIRFATAVWRRSWLDPADPELHPERGASTLEWAGLGAASIAVILVLTAGMQALGLDIIGWIRQSLIGT